jgi:predicted esterase
MQVNREAFAHGRLIAKPGNTIGEKTFSPGLQPLGLDHKRDALIYIPSGYDQEKPTALAVMLHGAGGDAHHGMSLIRHLADEANIIILAPMSRSGSWDIISYERFGPDIAFINQALTETFSKYDIDPARLAIGGFSDGASYALSVGLTNGDLFSHILAFSPGFYYTVETNGKPPVFISHGTFDDVLPINSCSRRIVPRLQNKGYDIVYHEFDGPHVIPAHISLEAVKWFFESDVKSDT